MADISQEEAAKLKGKGFLLQKDKEHFAVRIVYPAGIASSEDLKNTAYLAEKYGDGKAVMTVRLNAEIQNIKYSDVYEMIEEMDRLNLSYGGTGARVRPLVSCKGSVCKFGLINASELCLKLHEEFYPREAPHKFKINVTGCPNNCAKVQLNDIGFMGMPNDTVRVFIGGRCGRQTILGDEICRIPAAKASEAVSICMDFYSKHAAPKQRFGVMLEGMKDSAEYAEFIESLKSIAM